MAEYRIPGLGMRTIKTAAAVALCLLAGLLLKKSGALAGDYTAPFFACTAAIICMQDTVEASFRHGMFRLFGTGLGGAVGILLIYIGGGEWLRVLLGFLGIAACIFLCNLLRMRQASGISCVVFCIILLADPDINPYLYSVVRMVETAAGIVIAVAVNRLIPSRHMPRPEPEATDAGRDA